MKSLRDYRCSCAPRSVRLFLQLISELEADVGYFIAISTGTLKASGGNKFIERVFLECPQPEIIRVSHEILICGVCANQNCSAYLYFPHESISRSRRFNQKTFRFL
jgi:hypothetical protein